LPPIGIAGVAGFLVLGSCTPTDWGTDDIAPASCDDQRRNGTETDIDCGGSQCQRCLVGNACLTGSDCASGECTGGTCQDSHCTNLTRDRDEEGVDCGGKDCPTCSGSDPCSNRRKDENETDIDCGGSSRCVRCASGASCLADGDCLSKSCLVSVCRDVGTGGSSGVAGSGGSGGNGAGGAAGTGGQDTGGTGGSGLGGHTSESGGSGEFSGASSGGGTAETGGGENTGGQLNTGGAAAGEGGAGAPSTGGSESPGGVGGTGGAGGATGGTVGGEGGIGGAAGGSTGGTAGSSGGTDSCSHSPISGDGLVTDFSELTPGMTWTSGERTWGDDDLSGTTQHYGSAGVVLTAAITSGGQLRLTSTIPAFQFVGFALDFNTCSDASDFAGVSFTIQGNTAGSSFFLQLETSRNMPYDLPGGQCEFASEATRWEDCYYNRIAITDVTATAKAVDVPWSQFTGGVPITPVDETELLGMQLQFQCATGTECAVDVTITEVRLMAP
jgi:hypothetical protein